MKDTTIKAMKFIDLHCKASGSDKVYHVLLGEEGGGFIVNFAYGRRGTALAFGSKIIAGSLSKAEKSTIN